MVKFSGTDDASRQWRRNQAAVSSDISGLAVSLHSEAFIAALDKLDLSDEQRIEAITEYFRFIGNNNKSFSVD